MMLFHHFFSVVAFVATSLIAPSQIGSPLQLPPAVESPNPDSLIFVQKQRLIKTTQPIAERAVVLARSFLGTPYVKGVLDRPAREQLVINLRALDCWTLVEYCTAIALTGPDGSFATYQKHIQDLRYWGGTISGYGSRLHYFTAWILQAEKAGILQDITKSLGGVPLRKQFNYISTHAAKYPKINDPKIARTIADAEARLSRHPWHYIPKGKIAAVESKLKEGDIILLCSYKAGLDIAHEGFAVWQNGRPHLLHASSIGHRVIISRQSLATYVAGQRGMSGIMVARFKESGGK